MKEIAICIPTRTDTEIPITISYPLSCLAFQTHKNFRIYIRDEGKNDIFADPNMRFVFNLLAQKKIEVSYHRTGERNGVGNARYDLYTKTKKEPYVLWLDDDMLIEPTGIAKLVNVIESKTKAGFVQGVKKELNPLRTYFQDINLLNSENVRSAPFQIYFGDAAYLLVRREALEKINWDIIQQISMDGMAGEDVLMSLMMAQHYEGWGVPEAIGYHLSPQKERWKWEVASDVLQIELLKDKINSEILLKALPHMKNYIMDINSKKMDEND